MTIEELRDRIISGVEEGYDTDPEDVDALLDFAVKTHNELAALRAAAEPFVRVAENEIESGFHDDSPYSWRLKVGDYRRLAEAVRGKASP